MLTPARRRGAEILDDPNADTTLALRSLRDIALANRLFGGRQTVLREVDGLLRARGAADASLTLLDVGTGLGDIPAAAAALAARRGARLFTVGLERTAPLAAAAARHGMVTVAGSGMELPFGTASVDIVTCSQVLHHFEEHEAVALLQECTRVARTAVVIGELRRSWLAVGGLWLSSFLLGFHPVSRHDGVVSVLRGYTTSELQHAVQQATGCDSRVRRHLGFRLSAVWSPAGQAAPAPLGRSL